MSKNAIKKTYILILVVYALLTASFYYLIGDILKYKNSDNNIAVADADSVTSEIIKGVEIKQRFTTDIDRIESITIVFTKFYREGRGTLTIDLYEGNLLIHTEKVNIKNIEEQHRYFINLDKPINGNNKEFTIKLSSNANPNEGVAAMLSKNTTIEGTMLMMNNKRISGTICFFVEGVDYISGNKYYWYGALAVGLLLALALFSSYRKLNNGYRDYLASSILAMDRYKFLISQLVSRDFKSKYKRSVLGVLWSFLNPLLTMIVQFLVFSTFFKADTQNYPVYLLSGVVCYNFFKETTDMCLLSISGNSHLINKVYIPKYIFPLAKTISSTINLGMSLVPLLVVSLLTGIVLHKSAFLIIYFLGCLIVFSLGFGMLLATLMVFFRDIQFLWSVIAQIWQYATPIFYPAEIIPEKYRFIVRFNPLYHFIGNLRKCLIDGVSPEPVAFVYCFVFAIAMFIFGSYVFKKSQDKFTLYL